MWQLKHGGRLGPPYCGSDISAAFEFVFWRWVVSWLLNLLELLARFLISKKEAKSRKSIGTLSMLQSIYDSLNVVV